MNVSMPRRMFLLVIFITLVAPFAASVTAVAAAARQEIVDANGIVYAVEQSEVSALDSQGNIRWQQDIGYAGEIVAAPAIGPDGFLYVVTESGTLFVFNRETGEIKCRYNIAAGVPFVTTPLVGNDGIVRLVGSSEHTLNMPTIVVVIDLEKDIDTLLSLPGRLADAPLLDADNLLHLDIEGVITTIDGAGSIVNTAGLPALP